MKTVFTVQGTKSNALLEVKTLDDLSRISIHDAVDVVSQLILGDDQVTKLTEVQTLEVSRLKSLPLEKRINTDDNVIIEFEAPKKLHLFYAPIADNLSSLGKATDGSIEKYLTNFGQTKKEQASFLAKLSIAHSKKASANDQSTFANDPNLKIADHLAKKALELNPSVEAYAANYTVNLRKGNQIEADHYLNQAVNAPKTSASDWVALGQVYATKENLDASINAFKMATQADSNNYQAWAKLGEAVFNKAQMANDKGGFDQALSYFKKSREIFPYSVEAWAGEANVYFSYASRYKKFEYIPLAEQSYLKAFQSDINYWPARLNYAKILYGQGPARYEEALKEFNHVTNRLNPQSGEAHYLVGKILQSQGNLIPAYQQYQFSSQLGISDHQAVDVKEQLAVIQQEVQRQQQNNGQNQNQQPVQQQQQQAQPQQTQQQAQEQQPQAQAPSEVQMESQEEVNEEEAIKKLLGVQGNVQGEPQQGGQVQEKPKVDSALEQTFQPVPATPQVVMTAMGSAQVRVIPFTAPNKSQSPQKNDKKGLFGKRKD